MLASVVQWQYATFPRLRRGFDSLRSLQARFRRAGGRAKIHYTQVDTPQLCCGVGFIPLAVENPEK